MRKRAWIALIAIYLCSRLYQLEHWPVWTADEGLLALPAARWRIERDPFPDGFPNAIRFPLWTLLLGGLYGIAGPDLLVGRLLSVATGLLALVLLIRATGPRGGTPSAEVAADAGVEPCGDPQVGTQPGTECRRCLVVIAFLCDFALLRYQRYGLVESSLCFLLLLVGRWWGRSETVRVGRVRVEARLIAEAALAAALLLKLTAIVVLPGLVCHAWIRARRARRPVTARFVVEILPPLLVALEIYLLLGCLYPDRFTAAWTPYLARSADLANSRLRSAAIVLAASPGLWALALAGVWNRRRSLDPEDGLLMTWLGVGGAVLLLLPAPPVRYFMAIYPALILLAARWASAHTPRGSPALAVLLVAHLLFLGWREFPGAAARSDAIREVGHALARRSGGAVLGRAQYGAILRRPFHEMTLSGALILSDTTLARLGVEWVIYDAAEWGAIDLRAGGTSRRYLRAHGKLLSDREGVQVWRVSPDSIQLRARALRQRLALVAAAQRTE